jgi:hypothetical protein
MRSRVIPGSLVTIDRRVPVKRLKSVDLPTLGRPKITSDGSICVILLKRQADNREPQQRCGLPLYRIPADFAYPDALTSVTNPGNKPRRSNLHRPKKKRPDRVGALRSIVLAAVAKDDLQKIIFATSCALRGSPGPRPGAPLKSPMVSVTKPVLPLTDPAPEARLIRLPML